MIFIFHSAVLAEQITALLRMRRATLNWSTDTVAINQEMNLETARHHA